jgi:hypothetical protein
MRVLAAELQLHPVVRDGSACPGLRSASQARDKTQCRPRRTRDAHQEDLLSSHALGRTAFHVTDSLQAQGLEQANCV